MEVSLLSTTRMVCTEEGATAAGRPCLLSSDQLYLPSELLLVAEESS